MHMASLYYLGHIKVLQYRAFY